MNLIRWNPFEEFEHFFKNRTPFFAKESERFSHWSPSVDIIENEKEFVIKAELPEIKKEDIKVQVENGMLTISGERKMEKVDEKTHRTERHFGSFTRSFSLPEGVKQEDIKAENKDGMLYLHMPKGALENKKTYQIEIE